MRSPAARRERPELVIGWLYPELMSTYGDRGNVMILVRRCEARNLPVRVLLIDFDTTAADLATCDLIFGGGAQDRQQELLAGDLRTCKGPVLRELFEAGVPGLFVCGSPQLLGHWYMTGDGTRLEGLGLFDMVTRHFGKSKPRCIGNTVGEIDGSFRVDSLEYRTTIVGFENHGGRTYLGPDVRPFARVLRGYGNNGEDGTEGALWRNCIATYAHGPFLPKNPHIADWLLARALEVKLNRTASLAPLDDTLEWQAHDACLRAAGIPVPERRRRAAEPRRLKLPLPPPQPRSPHQPSTPGATA